MSEITTIAINLTAVRILLPNPIESIQEGRGLLRWFRFDTFSHFTTHTELIVYTNSYMNGMYTLNFNKPKNEICWNFGMTSGCREKPHSKQTKEKHKQMCRTKFTINEMEFSCRRCRLDWMRWLSPTLRDDLWLHNLFFLLFTQIIYGYFCIRLLHCCASYMSTTLTYFRSF